MTNNESLAKATKQMMLKEPFYGLFLIGINKEWRNDIDTACVSKHGINVQLAINPIFWENLCFEYKVGILTHEILHLAFQHLTLMDSYPNKKLFNIAADLVVNQYIDKSFLPGGNYPTKKHYEDDTKMFIDSIKDRLEKNLITKEEARIEALKIPMRAIFLDDFDDLNLLPKESTDYYYKELEKTQDQTGKSTCSHLNDLLGDGDPRGNPHWSHETWKEFDNLSDAEKKLVQHQIEHQLKETANQIQKSRGTLPSHIAGYINSLFLKEPPKFNWRGYIRQFNGGNIKEIVKKTKRKESKRFPDMPGVKIEYLQHILFAIDTSGSVSNTELEECMQELHHMHKLGVDITIIQADAAISNIAKYKKPKDGKVKIHGRGGTSFDPVCDYYNEHINKFSCMMYFTDGEAPAPQNKPKGKILWILSSTSTKCDHLPGFTIQLPK